MRIERDQRPLDPGRKRGHDRPVRRVRGRQGRENRVRSHERASGRRGSLEHLSYRTWEECVAKMRTYAGANAEKAWRLGRRAGPLDVLLRPPLRFVRQYLLQLGILDGAHGVVLCGLAATQVFLKYAELWDRTRRARHAARPGSTP